MALRKVRSFLDCGAFIEVISPELCPKLSRLADAKEIIVKRKLYHNGDLKGASIVVAATDDHNTNLAIVKESIKAGILVNVVDDANNSNFIVPSFFRRGDITIAISTSGRSPALARKIRTRLEKDFGDEYIALVLLVDEVREELKHLGIKVTADDWQKALDLDNLIHLLKNNCNIQARTILLDNLKGQSKN